VKKEALDAVNKKISELEANLLEKVNTKKQLEKKIEQCKTQLDRAQKLTEGLSDEKERWSRDIKRLELSGELIPGNSAIAACMLSYSGPFVASFRSELETSLVKYLD
jgi:dynein heavy chain